MGAERIEKYSAPFLVEWRTEFWYNMTHKRYGHAEISISIKEKPDMPEIDESMYKDEFGVYRCKEDDGIVFGEPNLDEVQTEAVKKLNGYVRVIAGAGSGKTRVLTYRYVYMLQVIGMPSDQIACITFTRNAAEEMRNRITKMMPSATLSYICTFHSLGIRIIREEHKYIKWSKKFRVLDGENDVERILARIYRELDIKTEDLSFESAKSYIVRKKSDMNYINGLKSTNDLFSQLAEDAKEIRDKVYYRYLADQKKNYVLDFTDMVCIPLYIFKKHDDVRRKWADQLRYIMVDEFQDVSDINYQFCEALSSVHHNLFVVGDPDQTIYSWRGAKVQFFMEFPDKHPGTKDVNLLLNRRSNQGIVEAANRLIANNSIRIDKEMVVFRKDERLVNLYHADTREDEAEFVANEILRLKEQGIRGKDIAILYRMHFLERVFADALKHKHIKFTTYRNRPFYESREVKDLLAYLRLITGEDDEDFVRAIQIPKRKIGPKAIEKLKAYAEDKHISLFAALKANLDNEPFNNGSNFVTLIEAARAQKDSITVSEMVKLIMEDSGMEELLRDYANDERLGNIAELKEGIRQIEDNSGDVLTLEGFLADAKEMSLPEESIDSPVSLMTIHAAKGTEYDYVFVVGMNEGISPSWRADKLDAMEEERRLAYVAFTRAKDVLYLSEASRGQKEDGQAILPSRFILDADISKMNVLRPIDKDILENAEQKRAASQQRLLDFYEREKNAEYFKPQDIVEHKALGRGVVLSIRANKAVEIAFDSGDIIPIANGKLLKKIGVADAVSTTMPTVQETETAETEVVADTQAEDVQPSTILELINRVAVDPRYIDKISALPLMCGTGKSSAISQKIAEVIRNYEENQSNDGVLIVSDTIDALEGYVHPTHQPEVNAYIQSHMDRITVLHRRMSIEEQKRCWAQKDKTPVLIITTQRYFGTTKQKIIRDYLSWEKGKRNLVIIDEQPYFTEIVSFGHKELNTITTIFEKGMTDESDQTEKEFCIRQWDMTQKRIKRIFEKNERKCDPDRKQDTFIYDHELDNDDDVVYKDKLTADDERFFAIINRNRRGLCDVNRDFNFEKYLMAMLTMFADGGVIAYRKKASGQYDINAYTVIDNREKVCDIGAKVIVLDGTADVSPAYDLDYIHVHCECDQFNTRRLDNLTIKIVNFSTSKWGLHNKYKTAANWIKQYMKDTVPDGMNYALFTYMDAEDQFKKVCGASVCDHFGNIKGRNDFADLCHIAQVGMNRFPPAYYFMYLMHLDQVKFGKDRSWFSFFKDLARFDLASGEKRNKHVSTMARQLGEESKLVYSIIFRFLIADIEQNLFRMKIRRNDCRDEVCYYLFIKTKVYRKLIVGLEDRFVKKHGAKIIEVGSPVQFQIDKMLRSAEGYGYKNLLNWMKNNEERPGRVFSTKDILEETGLNQQQFTDAKRNHPEIREYFENRISPLTGRPGNYMNPMDNDVEDDEEN